MIIFESVLIRGVKLINPKVNVMKDFILLDRQTSVGAAKINASNSFIATYQPNSSSSLRFPMWVR
jgi:hypothetical protein